MSEYSNSYYLLLLQQELKDKDEVLRIFERLHNEEAYKRIVDLYDNLKSFLELQNVGYAKFRIEESSREKT